MAFFRKLITLAEKKPYLNSWIIFSKINQHILKLTCLYDRPCFILACQSESFWSPWQHWSQCTLTCGGGVQVRRRKCNFTLPLNGGKECTGPRIETKICNYRPCREGN